MKILKKENLIPLFLLHLFKKGFIKVRLYAICTNIVIKKYKKL